MSAPRDVDHLLATDDVDFGCAAGFAVLDQYVEAELAGGDAAGEFPGLAAHLRSCPACREDYLGLLEATRLFGAGDEPPQSGPEA